MEIIKEKSVERIVSYSHEFEHKDQPGSGFSFPCNEHGKVENSNDCAKENYRKCLVGEFDVYDLGVQKSERSYTKPRIGKCHCGEEVYLSNFTNTCECGADYNMSGHLLSPRECWGEETGEHWTDCY